MIVFFFGKGALNKYFFSICVCVSLKTDLVVVRPEAHFTCMLYGSTMHVWRICHYAGIVTLFIVSSTTYWNHFKSIHKDNFAIFHSL